MNVIKMPSYYKISVYRSVKDRGAIPGLMSETEAKLDEARLLAYLVNKTKIKSISIITNKSLRITIQKKNLLEIFVSDDNMRTNDITRLERLSSLVDECLEALGKQYLPEIDVDVKSYPELPFYL